MFPLEYSGPALILLQEVISIQELEVSKIRKHPQSRVSEKPDNKYSAQQKEILGAQISLDDKYVEFHFTPRFCLYLSLTTNIINHLLTLGSQGGREGGRESVPVLFTPIIISADCRPLSEM